MKISISTYWLLFLPLFSFGQQPDSLAISLSIPPPGVHILEVRFDDLRFGEGSYPLRNYLYVLPDTSKDLRFEEVSSALFSSRFSRMEDLAHFPPDQVDYWIRLTVHAELPRPENWLVNLMLAKVESFRVIKNGFIERTSSGVLMPASERHFQNRYGHLPLLPITLPEAGYRNYYWRITNQPVAVDTDFGVELNFSLLAPSFISHYRHQEGFYLALYLGLVLAVGIYHLVIFFYNREYSYLWFSLYCLSSFMASLTLSGYALTLLWPELPFLHYLFFKGPVLIGMNLFLLLFTRSYLQTARLTPFWDKTLWVIFGLLAIGFGLFGFASRFIDLQLGLVLIRLGQNAQMLFAIAIFITAALCLKRGHQPARLYLFASVAFLSGMILNILTIIQVLPVISHLNWIVLGRVIQLILFSFGLAQLFKVLLDKKAEAQRLEELDGAKTRLYTNITHEFRTPLTIILGMVEQIKDNPREWYHEGLQMIQRSGRTLLQLVNQMLDLSKLESGTMPFSLVQEDMLAYLRYIIESFHSLAERKNIRLDMKTDLEELIMDYDPEKVLNIVSNLLSNAIKFTPAGGAVELRVSKRQAVRSREWKEDQDRSAESCLVITVADTGPGIPSEKLPYLFNRFYRGDEGSAGHSGGTGIGLALTKELVKLFRGKISVESVVGKGTTFTVALPITNNTPLGEHPEIQAFSDLPPPSISPGDGEAPTAPVATADPGERLVLLVIEDHADVVLYLKSFLAKDYHLEVAVDGQEGIEKAVEIIPDIIICDIMMPVKDGLEVCSFLKTDDHTSHIPIILLTAKADISSRIEGLKRGADAYLAKPFSKNELLVRLQKLVELRKQLQARYSTLGLLSLSDDPAVQMEDRFMTKLHDLLDARYGDEAFGTPDLCQALQMSRSQLYRKMAALTGKPVASYLRSFRLLKAKNFLQTTTLSVSEIAFQVGYKDLSHFSRSFRKEFGMSPSDLRD